MSRTFSMNSGSFDSLKDSVRCGCKAKARQMRLTVLRLSPQACAIERVLQCVASAGFVSSVRVSTASTVASVTVRGAPGRGSSSKPSSRFARKRVRHFPMVCLVRRRSHATRVFVLPAAHPRISRARWANACPVVGRRVQRSNVSRSSSVIVTGGIGRPVRMSVLLSLLRTRSTHNLFHSFQRQDTSVSSLHAVMLPATVLLGKDYMWIHHNTFMYMLL